MSIRTSPSCLSNNSFLSMKSFTLNDYFVWHKSFFFTIYCTNITLSVFIKLYLLIFVYYCHPSYKNYNHVFFPKVYRPCDVSVKVTDTVHVYCTGYVNVLVKIGSGFAIRASPCKNRCSVCNTRKRKPVINPS